MADAEMPTAYLHRSVVNMMAKEGHEVSLEQLRIFRDEEQEDEQPGISPAAAVAAIEMQRRRRGPGNVQAAWPEILKAAEGRTRLPDPWGWHSANDKVWILAPTWERGMVRAGLLLVGGQYSGRIEMQDVARPLLRYAVTIPPRRSAMWLEAPILLQAEPL